MDVSATSRPGARALAYSPSAVPGLAVDVVTIVVLVHPRVTHAFE